MNRRDRARSSLCSGSGILLAVLPLTLIWLSALMAVAQAQELPVVTAQPRLPSTPVAAGSTVTMWVDLTIKPSYHANANPASEPYLIPTTVSLKSAPGITVGKAVYPKGKQKKFAFVDKPIAVYDGTVAVRLPLTVAKNARAGERRLTGTVRYQACDDKNCLLPAQAAIEVKLQVGTGRQAAVAENTAVDEAPGPTTPTGSTVDASAAALRRQYRVSGLPSIVFLDSSGQERTDLRAGEELTHAAMIEKVNALKSGARLNASAGSAAGWGERLQAAPLWLQLGLAFLGGLLLNLTPCVYPMLPITIGYFGTQSQGRLSQTFGLAATYVLGLALVYSILGMVAALTGSLFGAAMQSPFVTGFVALVLFGLGLSMFGLFTLQPPRFLLERSGAKKGVWGALGMGALLGFVCAPCVGPVVAALLAYVGVQANPFLGFALFFALSLGLGLPYLLLGTFSGSLKALPKSGAWMEKAKKVFAVPLVLAALYYAFLTVQPALVSRQTNVPPNMHWPPATDMALAEARRSGQPVVLDFRADWCLPCKKLDRDVFSQRDVLSAARGIKLLQVDLTRANG